MSTTVRITFEITVSDDSSVSNLTVTETDTLDDSPEAAVAKKIHSAVRNTIYQHNNSLPVR